MGRRRRQQRCWQRRSTCSVSLLRAYWFMLSVWLRITLLPVSGTALYHKTDDIHYTPLLPWWFTVLPSVLGLLVQLFGSGM
jgi:hypothetical protein